MSQTAVLRPQPIPTVYLTGFLGAGKTTLLNRLLREPELAETLVIVNEFGEAALDHALIEAVTEEAILLPAGCLCCEMRGDLVATLENILRRLDNGRMQPIRRVVIEPTGLADPFGALQVFTRHPYIKMRFQFDGVLTLVDAVNGADTIDAHPEAMRQVVLADRILLTKTDLVREPGRLAALVARLEALAPGVPITDVAREPLDARLITEIGTIEKKAERVLAAIAAAGEERAPDQRHNVRSFVLTSDEPIPAAQFDIFLELLRQTKGPNLLRLKGLVALAETPDKPVLIHAAQHVIHPPLQLAAWPATLNGTRLVFIVREIDPSFFARLWDVFRGAQLGPDTPRHRS